MWPSSNPEAQLGPGGGDTGGEKGKTAVELEAQQGAWGFQSEDPKKTKE